MVGVGYAIAILFYALLVFAALTSTISMYEIGTAFFHEELKLPRQRAIWILTVVCAVIVVFCSLSVGANTDIQVMTPSSPIRSLDDLRLSKDFPREVIERLTPYVEY